VQTCRFARRSSCGRFVEAAEDGVRFLLPTVVVRACINYSASLMENQRLFFFFFFFFFFSLLFVSLP